MTSPSKPMLCPAFAPANALKVWTDGLRLFVELPGPHIIPYSLTDAGLSKALDLLKRQKYDFGGGPQLKLQLKSTQGAMAEKLLRQRGII